MVQEENYNEAVECLKVVLPVIHNLSISGIEDRDVRKSVRDLEYKIKSILKKSESSSPINTGE